MKKKSISLKLDLETHRRLDQVQEQEAYKFSLPKRRRKEDVAADILRLGINEFVRVHELDIKI